MHITPQAISNLTSPNPNSRLELLSDDDFAISIALPVIAIRVPPLLITNSTGDARNAIVGLCSRGFTWQLQP